jgi:predicted GNAT family N-acyltransferase
MTLTITATAWQTSSDPLNAIRFEVFVDEQQVPAEEELDQLDADSIHFLAFDDTGRSLACARLTGAGQIGRMAVLAHSRGTGVGAQLLAAVVEHALQTGIADIYLHAQIHAIGFYQRAGFVVDGDEFYDAGIAHRNMVYCKA